MVRIVNTARRYRRVSPQPGKHVLIHGDCGSFSYASGFGFLVTSPPYFHPHRASTLHGDGYVGEISTYIEVISAQIARCAEAVKHRRVCIVKTDVWYRGALIPISFELARACMNRGLRLRGHWIFNRTASYTPYSPTFSNIFVFADCSLRPHCSGVLKTTERRQPRVPSSFTPGLFAELVRCFSDCDDVLLDPFAGMGAVFHAAKATGRSSVGIESSMAQIAKACALMHRNDDFRLVKRS